MFSRDSQCQHLKAIKKIVNKTFNTKFVHCYHTVFSRDSQEAPKSDARSCVEYHVANGESEMVVRASKPISSDPSRMIELLANYGFPYWIAHVVKYHRQIGHETDMAPPITNPPCQ